MASAKPLIGVAMGLEAVPAMAVAGRGGGANSSLMADNFVVQSLTLGAGARSILDHLFLVNFYTNKAVFAACFRLQSR